MANDHSAQQGRPHPPVLTINDSEGSRTDEGRNKAWEMLKAEYPQSPWIQRIPKDAPAPAAPPQTDAPQKDEKPQ